MTWMMTMWWVVFLTAEWHLTHCNHTCSEPHRRVSTGHTDHRAHLSACCADCLLTLSILLLPLSCYRTWWILMLFWMKRTWRSQTQPLLKHPAVEKEQSRRRKLARTGEVTAQMTLKQTGACWTVTGARLTVQSEIISDVFCVARVASLRSWSRRARGKKSLTCQNLPVEAWVSFQLFFKPPVSSVKKSPFSSPSLCGSVTLAMLSVVPAVRTWGCQRSNRERRSCWTTRHWRMLETLDFTHHSTETFLFFFFFF